MEFLDRSLPSNILSISALTGELNDILAASDLTMQKYDALYEQIKILEARQQYISASLAEGELIAAEILRSARLRIENIEARVEKIIVPQKKQIAWIEMEIEELNQVLASLKESREEIPPEIEVEACNEEPVLQEITEPLIANDFELESWPLEPEAQLLDEPVWLAPADLEPPDSDLIALSESVEAQTTAHDKSLMHLDGFIDFAYFEHKLQRNRGWQVKVEAIIPEDNYEFAGYSKVSSAFVSALQRYDSVVLNEVYPFYLIKPNQDNIGMYLFNCLDDIFSFMDLKLTAINIWENQELIMTVTSRNLDFDKCLQGEDSFLEDLRGKYTTCEIEETSSRKSIFTQLFKNSN